MNTSLIQFTGQQSERHVDQKAHGSDNKQCSVKDAPSFPGKRNRKLSDNKQSSVKRPGARASRWLSDLLKQAESMLSPSRYSCITCNGSYTRRGELPLCSACNEAIPWILQVQCECCGRPEACGDCVRRKEAYFVHNRSAVSYSPLMKQWLGMFKYRGNEQLRRLLGKMLLHAYYMHHNQVFSPPYQASSYSEMLTYVPLSEQRLSERSFNQAQQLTEELSRLTGVPVIGLLERVRHTDKQSFKTRGDRMADLQGAFALNPAARSILQEMTARTPVRLYIIDDVYTTGSTLSECAKTIKLDLNAAVYGISWAR